jgi:hypothetical protein
VQIVRCRHVALAFVGLLAVAAQAQAQTGTISGTVVEEGTLTPLVHSDSSGVGVTVYTLAGITRSVTTDASGHYEIALEPGSYYVIAGATGHVRKLHTSVICIAADCPKTKNPVVITAGNTTTVNFSLPIAGGIAGAVRRAGNAAPIAGLRVAIYNASTSKVDASTATNPDGTYQVGGLAQGSYFARTEDTSAPADYLLEQYGGVVCHQLAPADDCRIASGTPITVAAGAVTSGIDFPLDQAASIAGTVVADGTGTPLANVKVEAYVGEVVMGSATTNGAGQYTIEGLPAGRVRVRTDASPANYVDEWHNGLCLTCPGARTTLTLNPGANTLTFSLAPGGTITGTLSCDFAGRTPFIDAFDSAGQLVRSFRQPVILDTNWYLDCDGSPRPSYTIAGLPTGPYFLRTRDTPFRSSIKVWQNLPKYIEQLYGGTVCITADCDVRKGVPVSATVGQTTSGINFFLRRGAEFWHLLPLAERSPEWRPLVPRLSAHRGPSPHRQRRFHHQCHSNLHDTSASRERDDHESCRWRAAEHHHGRDRHSVWPCGEACDDGPDGSVRD